MPLLATSSTSLSRVALPALLGCFLTSALLGCGGGSTAAVTPTTPIVPQASPVILQNSLTIASPTGTGNNGFIIVSNTSTGIISLVNPVTFIGTNFADFTEVNTQANALAEPCPATLAAGASCRIIIHFTPSSTTIGSTENAALQLTSGNPSGTVTSVPLTGLVTAGVDVTQTAGCSLTNQSGCLVNLQTALSNAATFYKGCNKGGGPGLGGNYTIVVPAGSFDLSAQTPPGGNLGQLDLSGIWACNGNFELSGAGAALTAIYTNNNLKTFGGNGLNNATVQGISFRRADQTPLNAYSMSQGTYVSDQMVNGLDVLTVNILAGYPSPSDVISTYGNTNLYIKAADNTNIADPVIDAEADNTQKSFGKNAPSCTTTSGTTQCLITLDKAFVITPSIYSAPNRIVCFKMEASQAYLFNDLGSTIQGASVGFNDVYFYDSGRGAFRGIDHPFVTWSALKRRAPTAAMNGQAGCFATWAGGPQFGQPNDPLITGIVLDHFVSEGAADETTEIFNEDPNEAAGGSVVSNVTMHNGFGGDIVLDNACGITFDWTGGTHGTPLNQTLTNCLMYDSTGPANPPQLKEPQVNGVPTYGGCVAYYVNTVSCGTSGTLVNANQ